jgi:hypothetical protein
LLIEKVDGAESFDFQSAIKNQQLNAEHGFVGLSAEIAG